jgi:polar amino acid transport system substrate-binding protein
MSVPSVTRSAIVLAVAAMTMTMAGCSSTKDAATTAPSVAAPTASAAAAPSLATVTPGKLTIATGEPAYEPWVVGDDPASGKGFESAVSYAVAAQLGYAPADVVWVRSTFDSAIAPGPKDWDFNLQQFSITDERKAAVDFSSSYYTTSQAIVTVKGAPAATATSLEQLKKVTLGVATGTTSYTVAVAQLGESHLQLFNTVDDAVLALKSGQIDGLVIDLPTAFYLTGSELDNGVIVGQFADTKGGDNYGLVLQKNSPLTAKVTAAVDALKAKGTLAALQQTWLSDAVSVPVLK